jgi:hypothetical protein
MQAMHLHQQPLIGATTAAANGASVVVGCAAAIMTEELVRQHHKTNAVRST